MHSTRHQKVLFLANTPVTKNNMWLHICCVDAGLILADSANMVMRIGYSWRFIKLRAPHLRLRDWAPSSKSCAASVVAAGTLRESIYYHSYAVQGSLACSNLPRHSTGHLRAAHMQRVGMVVVPGSMHHMTILRFHCLHQPRICQICQYCSPSVLYAMVSCRDAQGASHRHTYTKQHCRSFLS